jgi:phage terminase large subunit-like protein
LLRDGRLAVVEDASVETPPPAVWAQAVAAAAARWGADRIVAESNMGGEMVENTLRQADCTLPVVPVHASVGKARRAEPIALAYERGQVVHAGAFAGLEDQLCGLQVGGGYAGPGRSPDRADACVWALAALLEGLKKGRAPGDRRVRFWFTRRRGEGSCKALSPLGERVGRGEGGCAGKPLSTSASEQARKPSYLSPEGERAGA